MLSYFQTVFLKFSSAFFFPGLSVRSSYQHNFFLVFTSLENTTSVLFHHHSRGYLLSGLPLQWPSEAFNSIVTQAIISWKYVIKTTSTTLQKVIFAPLVGIQQPEGSAMTSWSPRAPCLAENLTGLYIRLSRFSRPVHSIFVLLSNDKFDMFYPLPGSKPAVFSLLHRFVTSHTTDFGKPFETPGGLWHCPRSGNSPQPEDIPHMELSQYCLSHIGSHLPALLCSLDFYLLNSQPGSGKSLAKHSVWGKHLVLDEPIL